MRVPCSWFFVAGSRFLVSCFLLLASIVVVLSAWTSMATMISINVHHYSCFHLALIVVVLSVLNGMSLQALDAAGEKDVMKPWWSIV